MAKTLRENDTAAEVKLLKQMLMRVLRPIPPLVVDTYFDVRTKHAVQRFQAEIGASADGVVGPITWRKLSDAAAPCSDFSRPLDCFDLSVQPSLPDTAGMADSEKYDLYSAMLKQGSGDLKGALDDLDLGRKVILGVRVPTNSRINQGAGAYDDRFVILQRVKDTKWAIEFPGNTDPSSRYEQGYKYRKGDIEGADADGDGVRDLGRLPSGSYLYRVEKGHSKYGNVLRSVAKINVQRDTNHDGYFDAMDTVTKPEALSAGYSILFHKGGNNITGSAGCQTLKPGVFEEFWKALGVSKQKEFWYVLVEAN